MNTDHQRTDHGDGSRLRAEALRRLRSAFGEPTSSAPDGEHWTLATRPGSFIGFNIHLNNPADPRLAEIFVYSGPHRVYTVNADSEQELDLGLRVVELIVRR